MMGQDQARAATQLEHDEADRRARQAIGQLVRSLAGGASWRSEFVATARATLHRALADRAIARAVLRALDALAAGKRVEP